MPFYFVRCNNVELYATTMFLYPCLLNIYGMSVLYPFRLNNPDSVKKHSKLVLPKPQISDTELEEVLYSKLYTCILITVKTKFNNYVTFFLFSVMLDTFNTTDPSSMQVFFKGETTNTTVVLTESSTETFTLTCTVLVSLVLPPPPPCQYSVR